MSDAVRFCGALFCGSIPAVMREFIAQHTDDEVWGALETGTSRDEGPVWLVVTQTQNVLAAASDKGRVWEHLPIEASTSTASKLARQSFRVDGREVFTALRLGSGRLERLFELAFLPRPEGLLGAAEDHIEAAQWQAAEELLLLAEGAVARDGTEQSVAYLNVEQKILLATAHVAMQLGREGDAVVMLASVSDDRPGDDLLRATARSHKTPGWFLTLALAHEEAGQPASAARVYARLHEAEPDEEILVLSRARALRRAGEIEAAVAAYAEFIERQATADIVLLGDEEESDLAAACMESAALLEELGRPADAALSYLTAIRQAPFEARGYERLFALRDALEDRWSLMLAGEILRLLNPAVAGELAWLPERERIDLPHEFEQIDDDAHDAKIVHPTERGSTTFVQRWIGSLTRDERDTRDIEIHAQRGDDPALVAMLESASKLAGNDVPRLYLSHGTAGVEVLGADDPFLMLGACHLDATDPRHLSTRELAFTLASQVEHIRAEHVLLTSSEFWRTFGTKSATTLLAFVPLGDVVSKLTDGALLKWVKKFGGSSSGPIRKTLELLEKRIADGVTGESVQSAYTASLAKLRSAGLEPPDESSLVKERLADFARAAQYTADRVGLLACDDVAAAVSAMVRLSPTLSAHATELADGGFVQFMGAAADEPALEELILRVGELLKFALSDDYAALRDHVC